MLGALTVGYLFLGGAGAGTCLVLAVLGLLSPRGHIAVPMGAPLRIIAGSGADSPAVGLPAFARRCRWRLRVPTVYRRFMGPAYAAALVALVAGATCLFADLGRSDRLLLLVVRPQPTFIAVGAWALAVLGALSIPLALTWGGLLDRASLAAVRALQALSLAAAAAVMFYAGFLLQSLRAVPLWATPWLPVLFFLSALSCGIATVLACAQLTGAARGFAQVLRCLALVDVGVIVLEAVAFALLIVSVRVVAAGADAGIPMDSGTAQAAAASLRELLAGENAWLLWGGFVAVGLAGALALEAASLRFRRDFPLLSLAAAACVLLGGAVMRACVVGAGLQPAAMMGW